jgi:STE24 endopeptidase
MNTYAVIILTALLLGWLLELAADMLNMGAMKREVPPTMADVYDMEAYGRSQDYTKAKTRFGIARRAFDLALLLLFWFAGGFAWLDAVTHSTANGVVVRGLLYVGLLLFMRSALTLPFSLYSTFVIEERFGFNRTTAATFIADRAKGLLLAALLGGPLLAAVIGLFAYTGPAAWLYCWAVVTAFTLAVQFVAPTWLMPLFNTFTPLGDGELRDAIFALASKAGFPLENVYVIDGSRRSAKSNAFFTGFGKHKRIALFDTLLEQQTTGELLGVLAHEIGHYRKGHIVRGMSLSIAHTGLLLFLFSLLLGRQGLYEAFFMEAQPLYAGLLFAGLLLAPLDMVLSPVFSWISRRHEREADRYAAGLTGRAADLVASLKKLSVRNLANLTPHPLYVFLHYSHPPLLERIDALEKSGAAS